MVLTTLVLGAAFTTSHWWVWLIVGLVAGFLATRFVKIPFPHFGIIGIIVVWPRRRISCRAGDKPLASQYHAWLLCHDSCRFPGGCRPPGNHALWRRARRTTAPRKARSEEHTSELQSHSDLVCRLLLEKKKKTRERTLDKILGL